MTRIRWFSIHSIQQRVASKVYLNLTHILVSYYIRTKSITLYTNALICIQKYKQTANKIIKWGQFTSAARTRPNNDGNNGPGPRTFSLNLIKNSRVCMCVCVCAMLATTANATNDEIKIIAPCDRVWMRAAGANAKNACINWAECNLECISLLTPFCRGLSSALQQFAPGWEGPKETLELELSPSECVCLCSCSLASIQSPGV